MSVHPRCQLSYKALGEFVFVDNLASFFFLGFLTSLDLMYACYNQCMYLIMVVF